MTSKTMERVDLAALAVLASVDEITAAGFFRRARNVHGAGCWRAIGMLGRLHALAHTKDVAQWIGDKNRVMFRITDQGLMRLANFARDGA